MSHLQLLFSRGKLNMVGPLVKQNGEVSEIKCVGHGDKLVMKIIFQLLQRGKFVNVCFCRLPVATQSCHIFKKIIFLCQVLSSFTPKQE